CRDEIKRRVLDVVVSSECFLARRQPCPALQADIDYWRLLNAAASVLPAERDMQAEVHRPKTFVALRRTPNHRTAGTREQSFDKIVAAFQVELNVFKCNQRKDRESLSRRNWSVWIASIVVAPESKIVWTFGRWNIGTRIVVKRNVLAVNLLW